tara:strand:+ start:49 stop:327 length:279 start_codon:yes stop_codon:yes gene_type:complete
MEEETTYVDMTPNDRSMAAMLIEVMTNSTKAEDRAWARECLLAGYRPTPDEGDRDEDDCDDCCGEMEAELAAERAADAAHELRSEMFHDPRY